MFPKAGAKLGPYEILGELGGGGMARVYRGWDGRLHREVAIKVIDDRMSMPGIGERFLREARAASALSHPNICTIFDIGEQDGAPYLVMELLEGETLREKITDNLLSVDEILRYSAEVADALAAAHARGIVHRDVKPANIFLVKRPNGLAQAKVLDFGLAKIEQYASEEREFAASSLTTMGATVGTVSYMSPEQARGEKLDARSDLFSLGIVMYEMATGQLPFRGNTSALVFVQLLGQMAPEAIRKLNGEIPPDLEHVIQKLLAKSARARYQSATELTDELQELADQRSGWLTRMKVPPSGEAISPMAKDPAQNPGTNARDANSARPRVMPEASPSGYVDRAVPARPGDPQAVRAAAKRPRDSAEDSLTPQRPQPRKEDLGEDSRQVPTASEATGNRLSGVRPVRTSIATNPRMSYPAAAPYTGQSGAIRAARETDGKAGTDPGSGAMPARRGQAPGSGAPASDPGLKQAVRDPKPSGAGGMTGGRVEATHHAPPAVDDDEEGVAWQVIALAIALLVLVGGFIAWKLGWLGGAAPMQGILLLFGGTARAVPASLLSRSCGETAAELRARKTRAADSI